MTEPTTAAEPGASAEAAARWIRLAVEAVTFGYLLYLIWIGIGRPPLRMAGWRAVMATCHRLAAAFGRLGIGAEAAYHRARQRGTLAD